MPVIRLGELRRRQGRAGEAARLFAPYRRDGGGYYLENGFRLVLARV